ncbi:MAG TPA: hypothetical protein VG518_09915 [Solirubrobacterales bacterium]|nr:hypothetical protein [Solirubrobacterales bacterium]
MASRPSPRCSLREAIDFAYPELAALRDTSPPAYLVGGAVRDLLRGHPGSDIDLVVIGEPEGVAAALGIELQSTHDRFGTAKARLEGHELDIARAREESYPSPGALPVVRAAATIEADLARRDFSINAMAIPLDSAADLVDPNGGAADLERGLLRVLHDASFADDPTRALRAARYAARFGFELDPRTERLLRATELETVSADRRNAELLRLAGEAGAPHGFELLAGWGMLRLRDGGVELARAVAELMTRAQWEELAPREQAVLAAALAPPGGEVELARAEPARPSQAVELARGRSPIELILARALGAEWLDRYLAQWRHVALEIDGEALLEAGVQKGPAVGHGLREALRRKLDGELAGPDEELRAALEGAGENDEVA